MPFDCLTKNTAAGTAPPSLLPRRPRVSRRSIGFSVALFVFMVMISVLADVGHQTPLFDAIRSTPNGDKICHFLLFGALAFFVHRALDFRTWLVCGWRVPVGPLLVLTLATFEELSQGFFPQRTLDFVDWLSDLFGIASFSWLSHRLRVNQTVTPMTRG